MLYINSLTDDPMQQFTLTGIPGSQISILMRFLPRVQQWIMNIECGDFTANGIAIVCSPNILRKWSNIIPFGIACTNQYFLDPYTLQDFSSQVSNLYLLDSAAVAAVEENLFT